MISLAIRWLRTDALLGLMIGCWSLLAFCALFAMAVYGSKEGDAKAAPSHWPEESVVGVLERESGKPTLVVFAHPLCPCTRATLWELERISNQLYDVFTMHVLFFEPQDTSRMPDVWAAVSLRQLAARIPGARLHADTESRIAADFGAYTSGHVLLYDSSGDLQFAGGITPSRGHTGSNPGKSALIQALLGDAAIDPLQVAVNPVFGCSLNGHSEDDFYSTPGPVYQP